VCHVNPRLTSTAREGPQENRPSAPRRQSASRVPSRSRSSTPGRRQLAACPVREGCVVIGATSARRDLAAAYELNRLAGTAPSTVRGALHHNGNPVLTTKEWRSGRSPRRRSTTASAGRLGIAQRPRWVVFRVERPGAATNRLLRAHRVRFDPGAEASLGLQMFVTRGGQIADHAAV
jgi:hypothetical protein